MTAELYATHDPVSNARLQLLQSLKPLIPYDFAGCHLIDRSRRHLVRCYYPSEPFLPSEHPRFWDLVQSHPLNPGLFQAAPRALMISDFVSTVRFRESELYDILYQPLGVDCELATCIPTMTHPGLAILLTLHRRGRDFDERDRGVLNLLVPHLSRVRWVDGVDLPLDAGLAGTNGRSGLEVFRDRLVRAAPVPLTARETEVLYWLQQGKRNSEIGRILGISERTAETHALRAYPKLGVENRYAAMAALSRLAGTFHDPQPD